MPTGIELKHPGGFLTTCDRCKQYKHCLLVPYKRDLPLTPPPTEPMIGPDYITERVVIDPDDIRIRHAAMCAECRILNELSSVKNR